MREHFSKWHGLGNDFVLLDRRAGPRSGAAPDPRWCVQTCDRHFGVGADGVLTLLPSTRGDVRMHVTNPDGSVAETCGNGIRCVARYVFDETDSAAAGLDRKQARAKVSIEDEGGVRVCEDAGGPEGDVRVDMGPGRLLGEDPAGGVRVSFGNPHLVFFGGGEREAREKGPLHPDTNVEFVEKRGDALELWVWERGAGLTLACGSGACATAVAAAARGWVPYEKEIAIRLPGGVLHVRVDGPGGRVLMRGPAVRVFDGSIDAG
jgi:diaminopimelate epimerase